MRENSQRIHNVSEFAGLVESQRKLESIHPLPRTRDGKVWRGLAGTVVDADSRQPAFGATTCSFAAGHSGPEPNQVSAVSRAFTHAGELSAAGGSLCSLQVAVARLVEVICRFGATGVESLSRW